MPEWFVCTVAVFQFVAGAYCGYRVGWKRGNALTPNDYVLRDVARKRDAMMRERDQALRERNEAYVAANDMAEALSQLPAFRERRPS